MEKSSGSLKPGPEQMLSSAGARHLPGNQTGSDNTATQHCPCCLRCLHSTSFPSFGSRTAPQQWLSCRSAAGTSETQEHWDATDTSPDSRGSRLCSVKHPALGRGTPALQAARARLRLSQKHASTFRSRSETIRGASRDVFRKS